jgi:NAD(P)-dependent dehydrogenase (short-subunit alcohol dehydrogenase family)
MSRTTILVVGTAPGSFGARLVHALKVEMAESKADDYSAWNVIAAGLSVDGYDAEYEYDVVEALDQHIGIMRDIQPYHVVYAVGTNHPDMPNDTTDIAGSAVEHFELNVAGFLRTAEAFKTIAFPGSQLVAISSNSARIPRSPSVSYCVSKAALSMAVRVLARRWKGEPVVWGVEPGLMNTEATVRAVNERAWVSGGATVMHRMPGVSSQYGLSADQLAEMVAHQVLWGGIALNGTLWGLDAGEL